MFCTIIGAMNEIDLIPFFNFFIFLFVPFVFGFIFKRLNISPIIGYIVGGVLIGNVASIFGTLVSYEVMSSFAHLGIVLLLFTIGIEINFPRLYKLKRYILVGGAMQIGFSIIAIWIISVFFGFSLLQAGLIGIALTSSSTAVVAKIIQDRGESESFIGEITLGILMFQDLAFIPFLIIFSSFSGAEFSFAQTVISIATSSLKTAVIIVVMYVAGKRFIPTLFHHIARSSRELLNLFVLAFIFLIIWLSELMHVSVFIGAFIAGVLVSETVEHYDVFVQVRPLRDVMAIIFFVYIGTQIHLSEVMGALPVIVLFAFLTVLVKMLIITGVFLYFRMSSRVAFSLGLFLFQVSENAFILLSLAFSNGVFTSQEYLFLITSILFGLVLTPVVINNREHLYGRVRTFIKKYLPPVEMWVKSSVDFSNPLLSDTQPTLNNHIIICGFGRVGSRIGNAMMLAHIPFIAIDYNFHEVEHAKKEGIPIVYGDPADIDVLKYAQIERARAIVIAIPSRHDQEVLILNAIKLNANLTIISRAHNRTDSQRLKDIGAHAIIIPEIEASLSVIRKLYTVKRIPKEDSLRWLSQIKVTEGI